MAEKTLPKRSATGATTALSDDEAVPDNDPSTTTGLLEERLRAWKHMCGYLENYITATEKAQKVQSKEYERILKTVNDPLREGHHFAQELGGVAGLFENIRSNTQGIANLHLETEKNLKGQVLPILTRLHAEIKNKSKELQSGAVKSAKAVDKARNVTQKHIEQLGQYSASFDSSGGKLEAANDPYLLRRGINFRLNKQILEENNNRQDLIAVQNGFQQFESHVLLTIQGALAQFLQFMGGQADRHRAMYADMVGTAQNIPLDFEWNGFTKRNATTLIDPNVAGRTLSSITFPNQNHRSTRPLIEGSLERRSRALGALKGYSSGYYAITPAGYLHEFKDDDDLRRDPVPELSLYLRDCIVGVTDGTKFSIKGKDVSGNKLTGRMHTSHELAFKAHTPSDAEKWRNIIANLATSSTEKPTPSEPTSPLETRSPNNNSPPLPVRTSPPPTVQTQGVVTLGQPEHEKTGPTSPLNADNKSSLARSPSSPKTTSPGHYQIGPGGTGVNTTGTA